MKQFIKISLVIGFVWSYVLAAWLLMEQEINMSFLQNLLIAVVPPVLTGIIAGIATYVNVRKSQLAENTEEIKQLKKYLGMREDQTLQNQMVSQFEAISKDIGRKDNASLTKQHQNIENCIEKSFEIIKKRYEQEDDTYRKFTMQQYELKKVLDNFSRDYAEQIRRGEELEKRNIELLQTIEELKVKLSMYQANEERLHNDWSEDEQEI